MHHFARILTILFLALLGVFAQQQYDEVSIFIKSYSEARPFQKTKIHLLTFNGTQTTSQNEIDQGWKKNFASIL
ncbi:unnamed protein product [Haemonchus placei]|uniref:Secreted protein n=1 Tax=Haemonchus placei TaxID=6290 RepID=A0A0N4X0B5_HAEPC|nr:unnamed protein product [Haemonchus placei]